MFPPAIIKDGSSYHQHVVQDRALCHIQTLGPTYFWLYCSPFVMALLE